MAHEAVGFAQRLGDTQAVAASLHDLERKCQIDAMARGHDDRTSLRPGAQERPDGFPAIR